MVLKKLSQSLKITLALIMSIFSTGLLPTATAYAYSTTNPDNEFKKVYVCKYVGTPGVNETLQTGNNPISVSTNALKDFNGLGTYFNDQHEKSVAIAWDNGDNIEPSKAMCPTPVGPTEIQVPTVPVADPCGPANAAYGTVPTGNYTFVLNQNGSITFTASTGFAFPNNQTNVTITAPTDSNVSCPSHDECPLLSGNQPIGTSCTAPTDVRETRDLDGVVSCQDDTYTIVHQERTRSYTWDGDSWEAGAWSNWTTYDTTVTETTNEQCPEEEPKKVFVCKFVGTPGIDERLQTGQNPISVSVNAIPNFQGIGSYFADAHGRSLVLAFDEGQAEPDISACVTDVCPLVPGVQTNTTLCPPGQGGGGQTLGTSTTTPQVLSTSTELPSTLPATGGANNPLLIVLASILAYGVAYFLQGRRQLARNEI